MGIRTTIHKLRHYSATELIRAGVDLRTVAGRLGHAEGGTTLAFYVAWVREADQRACRILMRRLPMPDPHPQVYQSRIHPAREALIKSSRMDCVQQFSVALCRTDTLCRL